MLRQFLKSAPLYLLALANLIYALNHGFHWLTWTALALAGASAVMEILCFKKRRKNNAKAKRT